MVKSSSWLISSLLSHRGANSVTGPKNIMVQHSRTTTGMNACQDHKTIGDEAAKTKHAFQAGSEESKSQSFSSIITPYGLEFKQKLSEYQAGSPEIEEKQRRHSFTNTEEKKHEKQSKYDPRSKPTVSSFANAEREVSISLDSSKPNENVDHSKDQRFDPFKTWSGKLERQLNNLRGRAREPDLEAGDYCRTHEYEAVPVHRFFDALKGPELDILRASEVSVLPEDQKWPFLLRFPITSFGMCLGTCSQAILWKTLARSPSMSFLHVNLTVNLVLWCIGLTLTITVASIYALKIIFYFEAVRREYTHPIRLNFFFAPWIACLFLALGVPPSIAEKLHWPLWYILMTPIFCLELKIYGQWMSGGPQKLSKVANPSNHLTIVGNFVGALLGASMGLKEGPIFFFAVGLAHYIVLFVTLYQRLPTTETLPKDLHPVFFLFVAAPSVTSMAWEKIHGEFDFASRIFYFISLFLYASLAVRINFFRGFRFSLAWWAYTFPMTGAAIATIAYSDQMTNILTQYLAVGLSVISTCTMTLLLIWTVIHAFVLRDLFPNDVSIAVAQKRPKSKSIARMKSESSDTNELESSSEKDIYVGIY